MAIETVLREAQLFPDVRKRAVFRAFASVVVSSTAQAEGSAYEVRRVCTDEGTC